MTQTTIEQHGWTLEALEKQVRRVFDKLGYDYTLEMIEQELHFLHQKNPDFAQILHKAIQEKRFYGNAYDYRHPDSGKKMHRIDENTEDIGCSCIYGHIHHGNKDNALMHTYDIAGKLGIPIFSYTPLELLVQDIEPGTGMECAQLAYLYLKLQPYLEPQEVAATPAQPLS